MSRVCTAPPPPALEQLSASSARHRSAVLRSMASVRSGDDSTWQWLHACSRPAPITAAHQSEHLWLHCMEAGVAVPWGSVFIPHPSLYPLRPA